MPEQKPRAPTLDEELVRRFNIISPSTTHTTIYDLPPKMRAHILRLSRKTARFRVYRRKIKG